MHEIEALRPIMNQAGDRTALARLRRAWACFAALSAVAVLAGYAVLRASTDASGATRWLTLAGSVLAYEVALLYHRLPQNHRQGETVLLAEFGPGTGLSLLRGVSLALLSGFLALPRPEDRLAWIPALLFTAADLCDYFDGYLARITDHASSLGESLDMEFDGLGMLVAVALAIHYGTLPAGYIVVGLARYTFVFGLWVRKRLRRSVYDLPPSVSRRPIAGLQMGFLSVCLWPIVSQPGTTIAALLFAVPFVASFVRDWAVVSGALDSQSAHYLALRRAIHYLATRWLPIPLRVAACVALIPIAVGRVVDYPGQVAAHTAMGFVSPEATVAAFLLIEAAAIPMIALGAAARLGALLLLAPLGLTIVAAGMTTLRGAALVSLISLLILGSGDFALWKPEEKLLSRRAGARG